jgi:hypothetical protein
MNKGILKLLLIVPLLMSFYSLRGQYVLGVDAPAVVTTDEAFRVVFTATGKTQEFNPPQMDDFQILAGPTSSTMSSTSIINGKRTHSYEVSYTFVLQPMKEGKFTIPSASVKIEGKLYSSTPVTIEVVKEQTSSNSSSGESGVDKRENSSGIGANDLILLMSVDKKSVVKGEPIVLSIKLLTKTNISGVEDVKFPTFNGFWSQETESPANLSFVRETYKGQIYDAALLRKYMLLPQQTGVISIEPSEMVCLVQVRNNAPSRSPFDDFFDNYQTLRKRISTQKLDINVSPLPSGAPASFTGGVGEYKMDVKLSRDSLNAHEAASLIVTITGTGNINLIEAPKVVFPPDFEAYDVKRSDKIASGDYGSTGTKTFEYPFIPRSAGTFEIDPVHYSYYSIKQGKYVTLSSKSLKIGVARGNETSATVIASGVNKQSVKSLGEDIRFISTDSSTLKKGKSFIVFSYSFGLSLGGIIILFIVVCYLLDKSDKMRRDVAGTKNRKAKKVARLRLKKAEIFLKQNLYSAFYEELHKAVLGYISDKFTIPVAELNRENISVKLLEKGAKQELIDELYEVIDACEYARYAPSSGFTAMENHYKKAIKVISEIES